MKAAITAAIAIGGVELNKWVQERGGWTKVYAAFKQGSIPAVLALPVTNTAGLIGATGAVAPVVAVTNPGEAKAQQAFAGVVPSLQQGLAEIKTFIMGAQPVRASVPQPFIGPIYSGPALDVGVLYPEPVPDPIDVISQQLTNQGIDDKTVNQWEYVNTLAGM